MNKIIALLSTCILTISVTAQTPLVTTSSKPDINETPKPASISTEEVLVLKETEFNFGKIPQGKPVTHIFEVTNNGKDSLHIVNVQASCGCTTPDWDKEKVQAPGEKTNITVGYNAASEGSFSKQIIITYNGTQTKQIVIKGEVWKTPVTSAPENKDLGNLKN
jgi:Protein of unknown function (DUF1573)